MNISKTDLTNDPYYLKIQKLAERFAERSKASEQADAFVAQNYEDLKETGFFSALIPKELGGGGLSYALMANLLRLIGQHCSSTALAASMHQHVIAANVWKYKQEQGAEDMLKMVAANQPILVTSGGRDWLDSNGDAQRVDGGYQVTAVKHFVSQSAGGDIFVSSIPFEDPQKGWVVIHFALPLKTEGIEVLDNWKAMGMRSTGSNTIKLNELFVPDAAIALIRPREGFHPLYNVISTVALPYIMAAYLGIAQKAASIAITAVKKQPQPKPHLSSSLGEMNNQLLNAEVCWQEMLRTTNDFDFKATHENAQKNLALKTLVTESCVATVTQAMENVGGLAYFRSLGLEKLFRDVQAAKYHPLPRKEQWQCSGDTMLENASLTFE